jgi:hypothetical protein
MPRFVNAPNLTNYVNAPSPLRRLRYFLDFNGTDSYAELETAWTATGDFEIEIEYSLSGAATGEHALFAGASGATFFRVDTANSGYEFSTASGFRSSNGEIVIDSKLHLVVLKRIAGTITITHDGSPIAITNNFPSTEAFSFDRIGGREGATANAFYGVTANVKLTNLGTPANSQAYRLDRPTGTTESSLVNTGTLTYNNIAEADRFQAQLVGFNWLGNELVTNGHFATDSDWTKATGWAIAGGTANLVGVGAYRNLSQSINFADNSRFLTGYEIPSFDNGNVVISLAGSADGTQRNATGTYTEILPSATNTTSLNIYSSISDSELSVDNVSVKRILEAP